MRFTKMHGCGNDFVLLDGPCALDAARVRALCDRRTGIGGDGVIVIDPLRGGRWPVTVHNADGSVADSCGNGYRCVARYLLDRGGGDAVVLATRTGDVLARRDGDGYALDLTRPSLDGAAAFALDGTQYAGVRVRAGNPNVVVFVADPAALDLERFAAAAREAAGAANVEAVAVRGPRTLEMRVHERGVGETLACGTGSCAAVAAAAAQGLIAGEAIDVHVPGGVLQVMPQDGRYVLRGPAEYVFSGTLA